MGRGPGQAGARLTRRGALLLAAPVVAAAACAGRPESPPAPLAPVSYTYLTPLPLDVAAVEIAEADPPAVPGDAGARLAPRPAEAVRIMARDRLSAAGSAGRAVFTVTHAALTRPGGGGALACALACRLEVSRGEGEAAQQGFVEAEARAAVSGADAARPDAADRLLRRAMDSLNVEFEFQLRRGLRAWLVGAPPPGEGAGAAPPPGEVAREELPRS